MWESRRDFQGLWEGWEDGFMVFHAFHVCHCVPCMFDSLRVRVPYPT